jgi:hypothetical protein
MPDIMIVTMRQRFDLNDVVYIGDSNLILVGGLGTSFNYKDSILHLVSITESALIY